VLGADGALLAGDADLGRRAATILAAGAPSPAVPGGAPALEARAPLVPEASAAPAREARAAPVLEARDGPVFVARSSRHAVAVDVGPRPLERLVRADLRAALSALDEA
jgi:hypothetical protein